MLQLKTSSNYPRRSKNIWNGRFFQKIGIYAHEGQKYEPEDAAQLSS